MDDFAKGQQITRAAAAPILAEHYAEAKRQLSAADATLAVLNRALQQLVRDNARLIAAGQALLYATSDPAVSPMGNPSIPRARVEMQQAIRMAKGGEVEECEVEDEIERSRRTA